MSATVVKIGGAALADAEWLATFAAAAATANTPFVIVHGGGPDITALSDRLGIEVRWHEGRRVTPPDALDVAAMVLTGRVNKRVVGALLEAGVDAIGLSGVDGNLLRADLIEGGALGRVGRVGQVRTDLLRALLGLGHTLVISPISQGSDGGALNVNADDVAASIAVAMGARELMFVTDVAGVMDGSGVRSVLDAAEAVSLVETGVASGGMRVKLGAALAALESGVAAVRIGSTQVLFDPAAGTALRSMDVAVSSGVA